MRTRLTGLAATALLTLTACGATEAAPAATAGPAAEHLAVTDAWVKAAPDGMTAAFGTVTNTGESAVTVVSVESDAATDLELHETVEGETGEMVMQEVEGFTLEPGGVLELAPGGDHIMLIGLTGPIRAGDTVDLTLVLDDGSRLALTAPGKDFAGANESYHEDR